MLTALSLTRTAARPGAGQNTVYQRKQHRPESAREASDRAVVSARPHMGNACRAAGGSCGA